MDSYLVGFIASDGHNRGSSWTITQTISGIDVLEKLRIRYGYSYHEVPDLTTDTYQVRGMTAMNDAIALGINTIGKKLHTMAEEDRPGKVIFAIMTDGDENSSREFSAENIKDMIKHQTDKYSWEFIFMAANIDVDKAADSIGIRSDNRYAFQATAKGVDTAYASLRSLTTKYRT